MTTHDSARAITYPIDRVTPQELAWLWPGLIPRGKLTILAGDPGLGKSFISLDIASRASRGGPWPFEGELECDDDGGGTPGGMGVPPDGCEPERAPGGCAVLLNAEDDPADTLRPRLESLGAELPLVHVLDSIRDERGGFRDFVIDENVRELRRVLDHLRASVAEPRLVVIDPVSAFVGVNDTYNNAQVRAMLKPLSDLAAESGVAVLLVTHLRKSGEGSAVQRAMGSLAFAAAARVMLVVTRHPTDPDLRVLTTAKSNLGPDRRGFTYEIDGGRLVWHDAFDGCADEVISQTRRPPGRKMSMEMQAFEAALCKTLGESPRTSDEIRELARVCGVPWDTARSPAVKRRLGVRVERAENEWVWMLGANE